MTWDTFKPDKSATDTAQSYAEKAMNMGRKNIDSFVHFGQDLAKAQTPTDVFGAFVNYNRQNLEIWSEVFGFATETGRQAVSTAEKSIRPDRGA